MLGIIQDTVKGGFPMETKSKISLYDIIVTALMAAIVFVVTSFLSIKIPTPAGQTMIKLANAFMLLAGMLFGGWRGGLAAGLGSMFYDFTDPNYVAEAWLTFLRFFLMGAICGGIAWAGGAQGRKPARNLVAGVIASVFSTVFYIVKGIVVLLLGGSAFLPALIAQSTKIVSSSINIVIAVVVSMALAPTLRRALDSAQIYDKLRPGKPG